MNRRSARSTIRPARPLTPFIVSAFVLFVWWVVAHNSGSGWVQALGDAAFGMVLVGLLGPAVALMRARLEIVQSPTDGSTGLPVVVLIRSARRLRLRPLVPPGPETFVGPSRTNTDTDTTLLPALRGVHDAVTVEIATAAPFGIQWWSRRVVLALKAPLHVAPRIGRPMPLPPCVDDRAGSHGRPLPAEAGEARGLREYSPGDRRRHVHWAATAHAGRLMVRDMEEPAAQPLTLRVNLPLDPEEAETTAQDALATVVRLLDLGVRVVLATTETTGDIVATVADRRAAGRRLARAVMGSGPPVLDLLP